MNAQGRVSQGNRGTRPFAFRLWFFHLPPAETDKLVIA